MTICICIIVKESYISISYTLLQHYTLSQYLHLVTENTLSLPTLQRISHHDQRATRAARAKLRQQVPKSGLPTGFRESAGEHTTQTEPSLPPQVSPDQITAAALITLHVLQCSLGPSLSNLT